MRGWRNVKVVYKTNNLWSIDGNIYTMSVSFMSVYVFIHHLDTPFIFAPVLLGALLCIKFFERRYALGLFISSVATIITTDVLKRIFAIPRPIDMLLPTSGYSFPSFHASITAAVVTSLVLYAFHHVKHRILLAIILASGMLLIILVDVSRVALQVHRPIDVIVGSAIGIGISLLVHQYLKKSSS